MIKLGILMDPIESINVAKDSSLAMLLAAQSRGWSIQYMQQKDLFIDNSVVQARVQQLTVRDNAQDWFDYGAASDIALAELDIILMRKDPPVDREFIFATHMLEMAEREGVLVVNRPQSLRDCNEKLFATWFADCCPPLLVSRSKERLRAFHAIHGDVVMKPLDGMGGRAVFRVKEADANVGVIIETLTQHGEHQIMAQKYLPEIVAGDKRILMIDGEPVPYALARIPGAGEHRGNLAAGGRGEARPLTDRDRWICKQVGPMLREKGLYFVGLDVIGDYLTEINVTSPTCIRELDKACKLDIAGQLMDALERTLAVRRG